MSIKLDRDILKNCVRRNFNSNISQDIVSQNSFDEIQTKNEIFKSNKFELNKIANVLNVPIVIASYNNNLNIMGYYSYGLDVESDFCRLAHASHQLCRNGMQIFPDITKCNSINKIYGHKSSDIARFYVGVPIRNKENEIIGSMAVLQESKLIAKNAFSLQQLRDIGQEFANQISAWPMTQVGHNKGHAHQN